MVITPIQKASLHKAVFGILSWRHWLIPGKNTFSHCNCSPFSPNPQSLLKIPSILAVSLASCLNYLVWLRALVCEWCRDPLFDPRNGFADQVKDLEDAQVRRCRFSGMRVKRRLICHWTEAKAPGHRGLYTDRLVNKNEEAVASHALWASYNKLVLPSKLFAWSGVRFPYRKKMS